MKTLQNSELKVLLNKKMRAFLETQILHHIKMTIAMKNGTCRFAMKLSKICIGLKFRSLPKFSEDKHWEV